MCLRLTRRYEPRSYQPCELNYTGRDGKTRESVISSLQLSPRGMGPREMKESGGILHRGFDAIKKFSLGLARSAFFFRPLVLATGNHSTRIDTPFPEFVSPKLELVNRVILVISFPLSFSRRTRFLARISTRDLEKWPRINQRAACN